MSNMPGHYHAEGDPADTVRYWDGNQWVGEPMPAPPSAESAPPPPPAGAPASAAAATVDKSRFGTIGIRIGAGLLDAVIFWIISIPFWSSSSDGNSFNVSASAGQLAVSAIVGYAITVAFIHFLGGTPGKLIVGLRITEETGTTTPPGLDRAAKRSLPGLLSIIPVLGGLAQLGIIIANLVMVSTDDECRSVFDRIGGTRVVRKARL